MRLPFRKFMEMQNVRYDYSSVHIDVPNPLAADLVDWSTAKIKDSDIYVSQTDPGYGREDEMHVTILYGLHSEHPDEVRKLVEGYGKIHVTLDEVDVFTNPDKFDVVIIKVKSDDLVALNTKLTENVEYTNKFKEYKPHITLAYVKKGKGWKYHGIDQWKGKEFEANYIVYSSKNGTKSRIKL